MLVFAAGLALSFSPNLVHLYGIHNDYEMALYAGEGRLFFAESGHLLAIGRPVAALLSNIPMMPIAGFDDFRWTRLFSMLTVCVLGAQMISIAVRVLRVRALDAIAVSLATFLVPAFIYSMLNTTAWAPHLVAIFISFLAYFILSRSNVQALGFIGMVSRRDYRGAWRQVFAYASSRHVLVGAAVLQLALYDFPPNALVITVFPVMSLLLSRAPSAYRTLLAVRDTAFIVTNLAIYGVTAKLIYIPFVSFFVARTGETPSNTFEARVNPSYQYAFNTDVGTMLSRLREIAEVSGDLWFLPQLRLHVVLGIAIVLTIAVAGSLALLVRRAGGRSAIMGASSIGRLGFDSWQSGGVLAIAVSAACFLLSASAVLGSSGGFITYRTIPICTALAGVIAIYVVRCAFETAGLLVGFAAPRATRMADAMVIVTACAAISGNFYMNYLTMVLARNETAYFSDVVRRAARDSKKAIVIIDERPVSLPEDHPVLYDVQGRWIPPYELGCLSGPCLQSGAIVRVLAQRLGYAIDKFKVYSLRGGDMVPGLTCDMLTAQTPTYPPGVSDQAKSTVGFLRSLSPLECVTYNLAWRDLSLVPGGGP